MAYPTESPSVTFKTKLYHPLINKTSGELDVKKLFPKWIPGKNIILQLISAIKDIFMNPKYFQVTDSFNPESGRLFLTNYPQFEDNAIKSSLESNTEKDSNMNNIDSTEFIEQFKEILSNTSMTQNEKMATLKKYYLDSYATKIVSK